jgi:LCP family protein required for cell wall assembly
MMGEGCKKDDQSLGLSEVRIGAPLRRYSPPSPSNLNIWQAAAAAVVGVCIGITVSSYERGKQLKIETKELLAQFTKIPANMSNISTSFTTQVPKIAMGPHLDKRMNLLLMGVDSNGRHAQRWVNTRSDTMIVASLDPDSKTVGLVSIPRDSRLRIADGHGMDKINSAHAFGGPELAVETVQEDFGIPIDHYVVIDTQGLKKVFEVLGPANVLVEKRMRYTDHAAGLNVALDPGEQTLTPAQMEEYVRFRHDQRGDLGRIERQQWFLRQISQKMREPQVVLKLPQLFSLATEYVVTDLSVQDMANIAGFGKDIQAKQVRTAMLPGKATFIHGGSYYIPDAYGSALVFNRLLGTNLTESDTGRGLTAHDEPITTAAGDAYAATLNSSYSVNGSTTISDTDKTLVTIKYAKGTEAAARKLEKTLTLAGYRVKYFIRGEAADCVHEQLQQTSVRADNELTNKLLCDIPALKELAVSINLDKRATQDFTVVVSPAIAPTLLNELPDPQPQAAQSEQPERSEQKSTNKS